MRAGSDSIVALSVAATALLVGMSTASAPASAAVRHAYRYGHVHQYHHYGSYRGHRHYYGGAAPFVGALIGGIAAGALAPRSEYEPYPYYQGGYEEGPYYGAEYYGGPSPYYAPGGAYHGGIYRGGAYQGGTYHGGAYRGGAYQGGTYHGGAYRSGGSSPSPWSGIDRR